MSGVDEDGFRADLACAGIALPPRDLEAAARIRDGLARGAERVRQYLARADGDASR